MNLRKKLPQSLKTSQNKQHQCKKQATIQHTLYDPSSAIFVTMVPIFISILHILIYEEKENILMGFFLIIII